MARGFKTGGRQAGTLNKRTQELTERLESLGCDPVEGLVRIANDKSASLELRAKCFADLLPYVYPRRRPADDSPYGEQERIILNFSFTRKPEPDAIELPATPPRLPGRTFD